MQKLQKEKKVEVTQLRKGRWEYAQGLRLPRTYVIIKAKINIDTKRRIGMQKKYKTRGRWEGGRWEWAQGNDALPLKRVRG